MKVKNYFRIMIFILGFFVLNHFFGRAFAFWSRSNAEYAVSQREFAAVKDQVWLTFLGDSHPQKAAKSGDIPGAYTQATSAESYPNTYYVVKYYLKKGDFRPDVAVVEIDPHGFMSSKIEWLIERDPTIWDKYLNYVAIGMVTDEFWDIIPTILKAKFPLVGGWNLTLEKFWPTINDSPDPLISGFKPRVGDLSGISDERLEELGSIRAKSHFADGEFGDELMVLYFQKLIDLLQEYDIAVVLVWYPGTEYYFQAVNDYVPMDNYLDTVDGILEDRQVDLILDYHDLFYGNPEYFNDPDHLSLDGAIMFTQQIYKDLSEAGLVPPSVEN